jgi:hypothetical protein
MRQYGLQISYPDKKAYALGSARSLPQVVLQEDGQWDTFLPQYEPQSENFETCGCTVWGTQNCVETLEKKLTGKESNYSERFNYILNNITCPGADPHAVCEEIRMDGLVGSEVLPMADTLEAFITPKPMDSELLLTAQRWPFLFYHEWVIFGDDKKQKEKMKEALKYSPLGVAVYAWFPDGDKYMRMGTDNHWCMIFGYEEGKYWKCFDSYDHSIKYLDWDFGFYCVKRFQLVEKKEVVPKDNWLVELIKNFLKIFKWS